MGPFTPQGAPATAATLSALGGALKSDVIFAAPASYNQVILDLNYAQMMAKQGIEDTFSRASTPNYNNVLMKSVVATTNVPVFEYQQSMSGGVFPAGYKNDGTSQLSITGLASWLPSSFTIYVEAWVPDALSGSGPILSLNGGSVTNRIEIWRNSSYQAYFLTQASGVVGVNNSMAATNQWGGGLRRLVFSVASGNCVYSDNGEFTTVYQTANVPASSAITRTDIGWSSCGTPAYFTGNIRRVTLYAGAMTGAQVCALAGGAKPIDCLGDSLTVGTGTSGGVGVSANSFPFLLARSVMPSTSVSNGGVGGQTSTQIAARLGGPCTATITGGSIPASGGVGLTFTVGQEAVTVNGPVGGVQCWIAGVYGTITGNGVTWTFTRASAGAVTPAGGIQNVTVEQWGRNAWTTVIWAGRNNYASAAQVMADVASMVANLTHKRFLILSVINRSDGGPGQGESAGYEYVGGAGYNAIMALNSQLAVAYPNNYLDIRSGLVAASATAAGSTAPALYTNGSTATPSTSSAYYTSNDAINPLWCYDGLHLSNPGYAYVQQQVTAFLAKNQWI